MKTLKISLFVALFAVSSVLKASSPSVYSHLPLDLKGALVEKFSQLEQVADEPIQGNIWIEFYVNSNHEICITRLSSNDLKLGQLVKEVLPTNAKVNENYQVGKSYYVKVRLSYI